MVLLCLLLTSIAACGDDTADAAILRCGQVCDAQDVGECLLTTLNDCKTLCEELIAPMDGDCQDKVRLTSDCQLAQPDVCDNGAVSAACASEFEASNACLGG